MKHILSRPSHGTVPTESGTMRPGYFQLVSHCLDDCFCLSIFRWGMKHESYDIREFKPLGSEDPDSLFQGFQVKVMPYTALILQKQLKKVSVLLPTVACLVTKRLFNNCHKKYSNSVFQLQSQFSCIMSMIIIIGLFIGLLNNNIIKLPLTKKKLNCT